MIKIIALTAALILTSTVANAQYDDDQMHKQLKEMQEDQQRQMEQIRRDIEQQQRELDLTRAYQDIDYAKRLQEEISRIGR